MKPRIRLLDGAMGTQLESLGYDVSGRMWGSDLLFSNPDAIRRVHQGYVDADADLVETATYQMSLEPLLKDHSESTAQDIMRGAIELVASTASAKLSYTRSRAVHIVLSLGPYGAVLSPSQEYAGIYPPPYGPASPSSSTSLSSNAFPDSVSDQDAESCAEEALAEWHLARLRIYAAEEETWRKVEWVAFETVPLLREVRAIRRAMGSLHEELRQRWGGGKDVKEGAGSAREWWRKRFWISSAYPEGRHPQHQCSSSTKDRVSVDEVLQALQGPLSSASANLYPRPDGIGINCTHPSHISHLADAFTTAMIKRLSDQAETSRFETDDQPIFVLYPDGGAVYDTKTRTWTERTTRPDTWAAGVTAIARKMEQAEWTSGTKEVKEKVWGGVIVGGCCKAGFEEIRCLRRELRSDE